MGNADSNAYRNHLSRFLPEEQSDIDGVFDAISGSSGSSAAKNGKATKKTVTLGALQAHVALSESPSETAVPPVTVPPSVRTTLMCQAAAVNSAAAEINGTFTADVNSSRVELSTLDLTLYAQQQALTSNRNVPGGFDRSGIEPAIDGVRSSRGVVMYDGVHKLAFNSKGQPCNLNKQSLISTSGMPYKTQAYMREPLPEQMTVRLYNGMKSIDLTGKSSEPSEQIAKEQFVIFMSNLLKGNADEKITIIMRMISTTEGPVKGKQIQEFTEDLIMSVVHVLNYRKELKGWNLENTRDSAGGVKALASQLLSELKLADGATPVGPQLMEMNFDQSAIEDWVYRVPHISTFLSVVIRQGLHVLYSLPDQTKEIVNLVPGCKGIKGRGLVSLFDIPSIIYINSHLPAELQHKWWLLFSSRLHGESFSQLCGHIVNKGPCIVILRDLDGYIFGGFASHSWEVKPQFQGDNRCFLFSVFPSLAVYTYTGYNDHYMYLNHNQQTMPNGLGMGGQHDYFGLWVDSDYGKGHSKAKPRCTTYNSPQLSAKENFTLDALEVWAVGDLPESTETKGKKSILDVDPEAQALLEMVGKSRQSEGLREPIEDEEDN